MVIASQPRFYALAMRWPLNLHPCPVEPLRGAKNGLEIGYLRPLGAAAVGVHGGHLRRVPAVLAEAAEARRVQDAGAHAQPAERAAPLHPVQHVLLLHPRRDLPRRVPLVEQRHRPVVGDHEEEACVQLVAGVVVRHAVELVGADQQVLAFTAVQLRERVPQPHHVHILYKSKHQKSKCASRRNGDAYAPYMHAMRAHKRTHSEYEAVAVLEDVAKEPDPPPHHAYEPVRHVDLLGREVVRAVRRPEQVALEAAKAPAPAEGLLVHGHEEDVVDQLLGAVPFPQALEEEVEEAALLRIRLVQHGQDQRPVRVRCAAQRHLQIVGDKILGIRFHKN